ncbi:unnamed protein product [Brachionus calyciflorus]|uniref:Uncharacterized protein n=1 Tax=Brachionus calyciflorus TaxID=104777 RepID=A0A813U4V7_9BILA|nr:unnamed protein product [Brachionus calyciflorus]
MIIVYLVLIFLIPYLRLTISSNVSKLECGSSLCLMGNNEMFSTHYVKKYTEFFLQSQDPLSLILKNFKFNYSQIYDLNLIQKINTFDISFSELHYLRFNTSNISIDHLYITYTSLKILDRNDLLPSNIVSILLQNNQIESINETFFSKFEELEIVCLQNNRLKIINSLLFNSKDLLTLNISFNKLEHFGEIKFLNKFHDSTSLTINLNKNKLKEIPHINGHINSINSLIIGFQENSEKFKSNRHEERNNLTIENFYIDPRLFRSMTHQEIACFILPNQIKNYYFVNEFDLDEYKREISFEKYPDVSNTNKKNITKYTLYRKTWTKMYDSKWNSSCLENMNNDKSKYENYKTTQMTSSTKTTKLLSTTLIQNLTTKDDKKLEREKESIVNLIVDFFKENIRLIIFGAICFVFIVILILCLA